MSTDLLRIEANERIDQQDFEFLSDTQQQAALRVPANFWTDPTQQRLWILSGFEPTNPAGKQVQVTRGRALLGMRESGQVYYGMLAVAGDATKVVDITAFGAGTYGIYIRFEYVDAESQSRVFWNPAGNGTEFAQSIATRRQANWSLRVETSNPGGEWFKIGEVDQATMAITDERDFYYEGKVDDTYANVWGAGNDRNADRQQYGVTNMQQFTAAMRTTLEDIKGQGLRRWWDDSIGGMNIGFSGSPVEDRLAIGDASHYLELTGTVPTWAAASADVLRYDRTSDYWEFVVNNSSRARFYETYVTLTENVGIGGVPESKLHIHDGDAGGVSPNSNTNLVIESDDAFNYLTFLQPDSAAAGLLFGAPTGGQAVGQFVYGHVNDDFRWVTNGVAQLVLNADGDLLPLAGGRDLGGSAAANRWGDFYAQDADLFTLVVGPTNDADLFRVTRDTAGTNAGIFASGSFRIRTTAASYAVGYGCQLSFYTETNNGAISKANASIMAASAAGSGGDGGLLYFQTTNTSAALTTRALFNEAGHFYPFLDSAYTLGIDSRRWSNVFTDYVTVGTATYSASSTANIRRLSNTSLTQYVINAYHDCTAASAGALTTGNFYHRVSHATGDTLDCRGVFSRLEKSGAGELSNYRGFWSYATTADAGPITTFQHFTTDGIFNHTGTLGTFYGLNIATPGGTGTINLLYGIRIAPQTRGTTSNYGLYVGAPSGGSNNNYAIWVDGGECRLDGDLRLGDNAGQTTRIRAGIGGTVGMIKWTFNSDDTNYGSIGMEYDVRATEGLLINSAYPITYNATTFHQWMINGTQEMVLDGSGRVGIGESLPFGTLHVKTSDSGIASVSGTYDDLVVEANASVGISLVSPSTTVAGLVMTDVAGTFRGFVIYDHGNTNTDTLTLGTAGTTRIRVNSIGHVSIGNNIAPELRLDVIGPDGVGTAPTWGSDDVACFRNNAAAANQCSVYIISGDTGDSILGMGDKDNRLDGYIAYSNDDRYLRFQAAATPIVGIYPTGIAVGNYWHDAQSPIHTHRGSYGGTGPNSGSGITIEDDANTYLSFLTPNTLASGLLFGDPESNQAGQLIYSHASNTMTVVTNAVAKIQINSAGDLLPLVGSRDLGATAAANTWGRVHTDRVALTNFTSAPTVVAHDLYTEGSALKHVDENAATIIHRGLIAGITADVDFDNVTTEQTTTLHTIPANRLKVGTMVRVRVAGRIDSLGASTGVILRLYRGSTQVIGSVVNASPAFNDIFYLEATMYVYGTGVNGDSRQGCIGNFGGVAGASSSTNTNSLDTTVAQALRFTVESTSNLTSLILSHATVDMS